MLHTLHAPAGNNLRSAARHLPRQFTNRICINSADFFRPLGIFRLSVTFAQQIRQKLLKPNAVVIEEMLIVELLGIQRVCQRQL